jgi:lipopolysaccharide transport system ATP-binding protein
MAGQLLGYGVEEITRLMPEIEAFAEIGDYLDQPVRVYSSGMQVRLAFSIATAHRPDVLIVDEALSVGDAYFQHKSFDRIREFQRMGTTLLIVSHDKQAIQSICSRAILLSGGRLAMEGAPEAVMDYYNALLADHQGQQLSQSMLTDGQVKTVSGTGEARIETVALLDSLNAQLDVVNVGAQVTLQITALVHAPIARLVLGYLIKDRLGQAIYGTNTHLKEMPLHDLLPGQAINFRFDFEMNLGPGSYSIAVALTSDETHLTNNFEWRDFALVFEVLNMNKTYFTGCAWLDPKIAISTTELQ